ncbi:hypothetical protein Rumeso_00841 [Rubellimicrobium mesophilum DSM 19309]|uniref:Uncharacterized protein n=1 Tax=Rubellimicrobium mesophilum DSM 19309 TaxID=442562 RepID=A0A017HTM0_9RHOB|nr:hypothetical protein [Rubellimicrobium mesophilum]EYD77675.1 hypothetical protein Rumeso_00841 [Rubellimicrobium mesophilum DSM 19309]
MTYARLVAAAVLAVVAVPALAEDVAYQVVNDSSSTLVGFYTSPLSDPNWSGNLVTEGNALGSGESGTVSITDGSDACDYDVKFEFEDGSELTDQVNVCDVATYTLSDGE